MARLVVVGNQHDVCAAEGGRIALAPLLGAHRACGGGYVQLCSGSIGILFALDDEDGFPF
jgi:hypothetical protein